MPKFEIVIDKLKIATAWVENLYDIYELAQAQLNPTHPITKAEF